MPSSWQDDGVDRSRRRGPVLNPAMDRMTDSFDNWTIQVRKGLLEQGVLLALRDRERYGYDLVRTLLALPGLGITEGTLYPLLSRLRKLNLVESRLVESAEGPARKYYAITEEGRATLTLMEAHLDTLLSGIRQLRNGNEA